MASAKSGPGLNSLETRQSASDVAPGKSPVNVATQIGPKQQSTAIWASVLYCLLFATVLWSAVALPGLDDPMCFGLLANKHQILESAPPPKAVFIGGSNLLFGLDGVQMEKGLHRPVVNMGLCLMFPLSYLFEEIKDEVRAGDLIVLSPEYADFSDEYANNIAVVDILDVYPRAISWILRSNCLNASQQQVLFSHVRALGLRKLDYASRHIAQIIQHRCRWTHAKYNPGLDVMNKDNLDRCGGLTWHLKQKNNNRPSPVLFVVSSHLGAAEEKSINDFGDYCTARGARFVMIPPSVSIEQYRAQKDKVESVLNECKQRLHVPLIATAERYAFPVKMIFNNQYHLNNIGRPVRTQQMIEDLLPIVNSLDKKTP